MQENRLEIWEKLKTINKIDRTNFCLESPGIFFRFCPWVGRDTGTDNIFLFCLAKDACGDKKTDI